MQSCDQGPLRENYYLQNEKDIVNKKAIAIKSWNTDRLWVSFICFALDSVLFFGLALDDSRHVDCIN